MSIREDLEHVESELALDPSEAFPDSVSWFEDSALRYFLASVVELTGQQ